MSDSVAFDRWVTPRRSSCRVGVGQGLDLPGPRAERNSAAASVLLWQSGRPRLRVDAMGVDAMGVVGVYLASARRAVEIFMWSERSPLTPVDLNPLRV